MYPPATATPSRWPLRTRPAGTCVWFRLQLGRGIHLGKLTNGNPKVGSIFVNTFNLAYRYRYWYKSCTAYIPKMETIYETSLPEKMETSGIVWNHLYLRSRSDVSLTSVSLTLLSAVAVAAVAIVLQLRATLPEAELTRVTADQWICWLVQL